MFNLLDIVQLKTGKSREDVEEILTAAIEGTKESLQDGNDVYWVNLCRFTWKQKAKTKKAAKEWTEHPYLAEGEKIRCVPTTDLEVSALGVVTRMKKEQESEQATVVAG